jgi:hypothetical protein
MAKSVLKSERPAALKTSWGQSMDVTKILAELRQEREQIEEAIISLERLARGRGKRRGRPPAWLAEARKRAQPQVITKNSRGTPAVKTAGSAN